MQKKSNVHGHSENHQQHHSNQGQSGAPIEHRILENLVELQKIHTNLAEKFDNLSNQIGSLLKLFEMSARSLAENPGIQATEKDKEFLDKIDKLLDQNKVIAKGLTLMDDRIRERLYGHSPMSSTSQGGMEETQSVQNVQNMQSAQKTEDFKPSLNNRPLPKF